MFRVVVSIRVVMFSVVGVTILAAYALTFVGLTIPFTGWWPPAPPEHLRDPITIVVGVCFAAVIVIGVRDEMRDASAKRRARELDEMEQAAIERQDELDWRQFSREADERAKRQF